VGKKRWKTSSRLPTNLYAVPPEGDSATPGIMTYRSYLISIMEIIRF
jgi:hypothetical protein